MTVHIDFDRSLEHIEIQRICVADALVLDLDLEIAGRPSQIPLGFAVNVFLQCIFGEFSDFEFLTLPPSFGIKGLQIGEDQFTLVEVDECLVDDPVRCVLTGFGAVEVDAEHLYIRHDLPVQIGSGILAFSSFFVGGVGDFALKSFPRDVCALERIDVPPHKVPCRIGRLRIIRFQELKDVLLYFLI